MQLESVKGAMVSPNAKTKAVSTDCESSSEFPPLARQTTQPDNASAGHNLQKSKQFQRINILCRFPASELTLQD